MKSYKNIKTRLNNRQAMKKMRYKVNGYWHDADMIRLPENTEAVELYEEAIAVDSENKGVPTLNDTIIQSK